MNRWFCVSLALSLGSISAFAKETLVSPLKSATQFENEVVLEFSNLEDLKNFLSNSTARQQVEALRFNLQFPSSEASFKVLSLLQHFEKLKVLDFTRLSDFTLGSEGMKQIAPALRKLSSLEYLSLRIQQMGPEGAKALSHALSGLSRLRYLDLGYNYLGKEAGESLGFALGNLKSLTHLDLSANRFNQEGGIPVLRALKNLRQLKELDLSSNHLGPFLEAKKTLEILESVMDVQKARDYFNSNPMTYLDPDSLSGIFQNLTSLTDLNLDDNQLGPSYFRDLVPVFEKMTSLKHLTVYSNNLGDEEYKEFFVPLMKKNKELSVGLATNIQ